jgi:hypothetical protein
LFPAKSSLKRYYRVLIGGKNCWANLDGTCRRLGFVTIRAAEAQNADQAAAAALEQLKEELRQILLNNPEDVPEYTITEIFEIDEETAKEIPGAGCTWYPDDHPSPN